MAVYVIGHRPVASKIKIGSAADPEARLRTLCLPTDRTAIPPDIDRSTLELLHCFDDGDWMMEHWLHGEFRKARAEASGSGSEAAQTKSCAESPMRWDGSAKVGEGSKSIR